MLPRFALALLLALPALAGCVTEPEAPAAPPAAPEAATAPPAGNGNLTLAGCLQFHTYYTNPVGPFEGFVPEGFRIETKDDAGQTFDLRVGTSLCENGTSEMIVAVPVIPPEGNATEGVLFEEVPVVMHVKAGPLFDAYAAWGFNEFLRVSEFPSRSSAEASPLLRQDQLVIRAEGEQYDQVTDLQPSSGTFGAEKYVLWAVANGTATGRILVDNSEGPEVGFGSATLRYSGPGGAPPAAAGIAHVVDGVTMTFRKA